MIPTIHPSQHFSPLSGEGVLTIEKIKEQLKAHDLRLLSCPPVHGSHSSALTHPSTNNKHPQREKRVKKDKRTRRDIPQQPPMKVLLHNRSAKQPHRVSIPSTPPPTTIITTNTTNRARSLRLPPCPTTLKITSTPTPTFLLVLVIVIRPNLSIKPPLLEILPKNPHTRVHLLHPPLFQLNQLPPHIF